MAEIRKKLNELVDSDETIYRVTKPWKKARFVACHGAVCGKDVVKKLMRSCLFFVFTYKSQSRMKLERKCAHECSNDML